MKHSLISVIVPIYNVEDYLPRCIESIINQTYKNIEIILIDDGSTDNSLKICKDYAEKDKRIIVINQENKGLSSARNAGLDIHKGKYIVFIDSDDYVCDTYIEKLYNNIIETKSDISICDFYRFINGKIIKNSYLKTHFIVEDNSKYDFLENEYYSPTNYQWTKMYKSEIFGNLRYPVGKNFEDVYLIVYELYKAKRISYMLEPLYYYRHRKDSITGDYKMDRFDAIDALDNRIKFYEEHNLNEHIIPTEINQLNRIIIYVYNINKKVLSKENLKIIELNKKRGKKLAKELLKEKISLKRKIEYLMFLYFNPLLKTIFKIKSLFT